METDKQNPNEDKTNSIVHPKSIKNQWPAHVTVLNLSHRNIPRLDENLALPQNLLELDMSHNGLGEIPACVLKLTNVKRLDVSFNAVQYFDQTPGFLHSIEQLNISKNCLRGPPYWVWSKSPKKLAQLDISCNPEITVSLDKAYFEELMWYMTPVIEVKLFNCKLRRHLQLIGTFDKAKVLEIGTCDFTRTHRNSLECIPCKGLDQCCDIQKLSLVNTQLYTIERNIDIYKQLVEINISYNYINSLPQEFCNLLNLKVCVLSENRLLYLPDDIWKLQQLECLHVDSNNLCALPESLNELPNLKVLDLYNNDLYDIPEGLNVQEMDLAQNYLDEPEAEAYLERKERLRLNAGHRFDGRKPVPEDDDSKHSSNELDDIEDPQLVACMQELCSEEQSKPEPESEEDWDSDEYWVPVGCRVLVSPPVYPAWFYLVKQKMEEGNFCPMDNHVRPVHEKIMMERRLKPKEWFEVEGQFDDLTDDDS